MHCQNCKKEVDPVVIPTPETIHEAALRCPECDRFLAWKAKEKNTGKRPKNPITPRGLGIDFCELCRLSRADLPDKETLEIHHLDWNYENNTRENLLVVCTACHAMVNFSKTYRGHFARKIQRITGVKQ